MGYLHTIDIAHPPLRVAEAEDILDEMLRTLQTSQQWRSVKIIHGYGKSGKGGSLKMAVLNWCYRNKGRVRGVITGEQYSAHERTTQDMRTQCGQIPDPDLDSGNPGITIVWIK